MKTHIKICGFTEAVGLQAAVDVGVDAIGLVLDPSPRQLSLGEAERLRLLIPDHIQFFAVCGRPGLAEVLEIHRVLQPNAIQLMSDAMPDPSLGLPILPAFEDGEDLVERVQRYCSASEEESPLFLTDGPKPGSGMLADWGRLRGLGSLGRMMIAGGLRPDNVEDAIRQLRPWGVDVSSGVESAPGYKSPERVEAFVEAVRRADAAKEDGHV